MSTFFGFFNRDGKPASKGILTELAEAAGRWSPDAVDSYCSREIAMGQATLWNTPESRFEKIEYPKEKLTVVADVRLDNRQELAQKFGLSNKLLSKTTDIDMILLSYQRWGPDCPGFMLGDFSFAIWDQRKKRLLCARDQLGVRPLYFHLSRDLFVFGNDLESMVCHPEVSTQLDERAIANYLVRALLIHQRRTFFKDIEKLQPGHWLLVDQERMKMQRYWNPRCSPGVILPDATACAEKLREILDRAIQDRLRTVYPVSSHLSGGLDSSTIAAIAARKLRGKGEGLLSFNWAHNPAEDELSSKEWTNSLQIAEQEGIDHRFINITEHDIFTYMGKLNMSFGDSAGFWYEYPLRKQASACDCRTVFSGWGGDELATYHGNSFLSNLARDGRFVRLFHECRNRVKGKKRRAKQLISLAYHWIFMPFVPRNLYCHMPLAICQSNISAEFLNKEFRSLVEEEVRKQPVVSMQPQITVRDHMTAYIEHGHLQARMTSWAASGMNNRLQYVFPLLDRRLVEFILGVPYHYFVHEGVPRYLYRLAVDGLIPPDRLWQHKEPETNRVTRLGAIALPAYKKICAKLSEEDADSSFINVATVTDRLDQPVNDIDSIGVYAETHRLLSVLMTEKNLMGS